MPATPADGVLTIHATREKPLRGRTAKGLSKESKRGKEEDERSGAAARMARRNRIGSRALSGIPRPRPPARVSKIPAATLKAAGLAIRAARLLRRHTAGS